MAPLPLEFTQTYLSRLELLRMKAKRSFLGTRQGSHLSLKRGHGMEFSDYREYQLGDNPRYIDWGVYARSDRLYVKQFQEEQDLPIFLILDGTASMHYPEKDRKWFKATQIAASLTYIALMQQDEVRVSVPGSFVGNLYTGARSFYRMADDLERSEPTPHEDFFESASRVVHDLTFPGLLIFISDFLSPLNQINALLETFRAKNLDICSIQVLGDEDLSPSAGSNTARLVDSETGESYDMHLDSNIRREYAEHLERHIDSLKSLCEGNAITYLYCHASSSLEDFIFEEMIRTGLVR